MSEPKTLSEWLPSGRGCGRKFIRADGLFGTPFEPIFSNASGAWYGLRDSGDSDCYTKDVVWKEYTPPKKKVKKWLWAKPHKDWYVHTIFFYKEDEFDVKKDWIKIQGTMIEVDDE